MPSLSTTSFLETPSAVKSSPCRNLLSVALGDPVLGVSVVSGMMMVGMVVSLIVMVGMVVSLMVMVGMVV